ncbi:MAG: response regulator [Betaproteobacteria bacterium]
MAAQQALSVLVVDDDEYTRIFVQRFLPATLRTSTASNGREAFEAVQRDPPDVIVMDLDMPVMGGLEAAALIRKWESESGHPRRAMIAMSSHDDPAIAERSLQAGFDRCLTKPVSPDAIRRAVADLGRAASPVPAPRDTPGPNDKVIVQANLRGVLPGFLASRRALLDDLAEAVARGDAEGSRALAHKLAGSFSLYGFHWAAAQGKRIERSAGANALAGLAGEVAALRRHFDTVRVECGAQPEIEAPTK